MMSLVEISQKQLMDEISK